ncbi:MAG: signal peptidase II [Candidatus Falkowbacteria bacterium]
MSTKALTTFKIAIVYAMAILLLAADRAFKMLSRKFGDLNLDIWPWLGFRYQLNRGIAFSLPLGGWLLIIISIIVIYYIGRYTIKLYQKKQAVMALLLSLIGLGAIGNLVDRLIYGAVIDYLDVRLFVCNLSDALISVGTILLLLALLFEKKREL